MQEYQNVAYAYCNFNQVYGAISALWDPSSTEAQGRMVSRVATSMLETWWYKTNCIVDGFLGKNFEDIGFCSGQLFTIVFDVSFG